MKATGCAATTAEAPWSACPAPSTRASECSGSRYIVGASASMLLLSRQHAAVCPCQHATLFHLCQQLTTPPALSRRPSCSATCAPAQTASSPPRARRNPLSRTAPTPAATQKRSLCRVCRQQLLRRRLRRAQGVRRPPLAAAQQQAARQEATLQRAEERRAPRRQMQLAAAAALQSRRCTPRLQEIPLARAPRAAASRSQWRWGGAASRRWLPRQPLRRARWRARTLGWCACWGARTTLPMTQRCWRGPRWDAAGTAVVLLGVAQAGAGGSLVELCTTLCCGCEAARLHTMLTFPSCTPCSRSTP